MSFLGGAPKFVGRSPVQFICDDAPSLSVTSSSPLFNNPRILKVQAGNVMKIAPAIDGTQKITGQGEYAPFALSIQWPQIGYDDYLRLAQLVQYNLTFISYRNLGYYGRMMLNGPSADKPYTADVVSCDATFLVLGPSADGGANAVNSLAAPTTFTIESVSGSGFMPNGTTTHYFLTFHTIWGETTFFHNQQTTGGSGNAWANIIDWTWPSSNYCTYASLYACSADTPASALLMAEILSTQQGTWTDLVGVAGISPPGAAVYQTPPTVGNAYTGKWEGGVWINGN